MTSEQASPGTPLSSPEDPSLRRHVVREHVCHRTSDPGAIRISLLYPTEMPGSLPCDKSQFLSFILLGLTSSLPLPAIQSPSPIHLSPAKAHKDPVQWAGVTTPQPPQDQPSLRRRESTHLEQASEHTFLEVHSLFWIARNR